MTQPQSVLITGASSGIGAALACHYAQKGVFLVLTGRDAARLDHIAEQCRLLGADVESALVDATDQIAMENLITTTNQNHPLDLVIANAGISGSQTGQDWDAKNRSVLETNIMGVINTVHPAITAMKDNQNITVGLKGQIAIVSSLAGYRGMASAPAYSASKVCVKAYGEGLRPSLAKDGIGLSVICPGFVESRITDQNSFKMPLLMTAPKAATLIAKGLAKKKGVIAFPAPMVFGAWLLSTLPQALAEWVAKKLPEKG